jgi:hypothetical protein
MNELAHSVFANEHLRLLDDKIREKVPVLHRALYPRRIVPPTGYFNPKWYSASLAVLHHNWVMPENYMLPHTTGAMMSLFATKYGLPFYFIQPDFAEAVAQTEPPEDFFLKDIQFPMPAFCFVLPDSFIQRHLKYYVPFVGVATAVKGIYPGAATPYPSTEIPMEHATALLVEQERFILHYPMYCADTPPVDYTGNYPLEANLSSIEEATFHDATGLESARFEARHGCAHGFKPTGPEGDEEKEFQRKVTYFVVKLLLALTAEPEYIVPGGLQRKEKRDRQGNIEREALWNPNIIGAKFRCDRSAGPGTGTHASPGWHWRRRRMTYQVFGKRTDDFVYRESLPKDEKGRVDWAKVPEETRQRFWRNHKLIWLKPTLVNAPDAPEHIQKNA